MNKQINYREVTPEELTFLQLKVNWSDPTVRTKLAFNGIALNILVNDAVTNVRQAVAFRNYGLDILANDQNETVRATVRMLQREQTYQKAKEITNDIFRQAGCL